MLALIVGLFTMSGVVVYVRMTTPGVGDPALANMLLIAVVVLFVMSATTYAFARPKFLARVGASKDEALALIRSDRMPLPLYYAAILGAALAEGPGLFGAIVYFLGGPVYALAAPIVAIIAIAMLIPSRDRTEELVRGLASE